MPSIHDPRGGSGSHRRTSQPAPGYKPSAYSRSAHRTGHRQTAAPRPSRPVQPVHRRATRRRSPLPAIIAVMAAAAIVVLGIFVVVPGLSSLFQGEQAQSVEAGQEVEVTIPQGASGDAIASKLSSAHVIEDPKDYYAAVKKLNADTQLKPGNYLFTTGQDPVEVVRQLMAGPNADGATLTIPEGLTVSQTAARVEAAYGISADEFLAQAKASNYAAEYSFLSGVADDSLEGFLCPKTYTFTDTPTADQVIRAMLDQYEVEMASFDFDAARNLVKERYGLDMSDYDFIVLASVVEREGLNDEQRAKVASTFYNRLQQGMRLQSDATLTYVTGGAVTASDIRTIDSPYNSYSYDGLPPTPICSPSANSITATLEPAQTDYLYFYITTDGEWFSKTHDEHLAAIKENS